MEIVSSKRVNLLRAKQQLQRQGKWPIPEPEYDVEIIGIKKPGYLTVKYVPKKSAPKKS
jgi:hypothetical protein